MIEIKWRSCKNGNILGRYKRYYVHIEPLGFGECRYRISWCHQLITNARVVFNIDNLKENAIDCISDHECELRDSIIKDI